MSPFPFEKSVTAGTSVVLQNLQGTAVMPSGTEMHRMTGMVITWVEADPASERAIDALGLAVQADRIADELLPDLSVLTRRARYLSFFCWAVDRARNGGNPERVIRRLEGRLALHEAQVHQDQDGVCRGIVGRTVIDSYLKRNRNRPPAHPENLYKSSAFWYYRPLMRSLGLLEPSAGLRLTAVGQELAQCYGSSTRGRFACLGDISPREQHLIKKQLGLIGNRRTTHAGELRQQTLGELHRHFAGQELNPELVLPRYRRRPPNSASPVRWALHKAHAWAALSLGLNLAFATLIDRGSASRLDLELRRALHLRMSFPGLRTFRVKGEDVPRHIVGLLRYARSLRVHDLVPDKDVEDIAAQLVVRNRPREFIEMLERRHTAVKGAEGWLRLVGSDGRVQRLASERKNLPTRAGLYPYRLNAFWELMTDLGLWR